MMIMKPIIFLDFDGVLNTDKNLQAILRGTGSFKDRYGTVFDPEAVENLKKITDTVDCDIVISSSWRYLGFETMQRMWNDRKLPGKIVATTEYNPEFAGEGRRGKEIQAYLTNLYIKEKKSRSYVILDDIDDFLLFQKRHFILIDGKVGITAKDVEKAINILNDNFTYDFIK